MQLTPLQLEQVQKLGGGDPYTVIVTTPTGKGAPLLKALVGPSFSREALVVVAYDVAFRSRGIFQLKENSDSDKLAVCANHHSLNSARAFRNRLEQDSATNGRIPIIQDQWKRRMSLIMGLALCGLVPGSTVAVYNGSNQVKNRIFRVTQTEIVAMVPDAYTPTGDWFRDFQTLVHTIWFHYPQDLTGHDSALKRLSLEMV